MEPKPVGVLRRSRERLREFVFAQRLAARDFRSGSFLGYPLNNQKGRVELVRAILKACALDQVVETGSYRGASTAWFADEGMSVYSVEIDRRMAYFCRMRLAGRANVHLGRGDSVRFLRRLAHRPPAHRPTFFYLDAHWRNRLPLAEELRVVFSSFAAPVVMIDDFVVPDDPGYAFDDYGPGRRLDIDYVAHSGVAGLSAFFPTLHSSSETGFQRGCVVLTARADYVRKLGELPSLRAYGPVRAKG